VILLLKMLISRSNWQSLTDVFWKSASWLILIR